MKNNVSCLALRVIRHWSVGTYRSERFTALYTGDSVAHYFVGSDIALFLYGHPTPWQCSSALLRSTQYPQSKGESTFSCTGTLHPGSVALRSWEVYCFLPTSEVDLHLYGHPTPWLCSSALLSNFIDFVSQRVTATTTIFGHDSPSEQFDDLLPFTSLLRISPTSNLSHFEHLPILRISLFSNLISHRPIWDDDQT